MSVFKASKNLDFLTTQFFILIRESIYRVTSKDDPLSKEIEFYKGYLRAEGRIKGECRDKVSVFEILEKKQRHFL